MTGRKCAVALTVALGAIAWIAACDGEPVVAPSAAVAPASESTALLSAARASDRDGLIALYNATDGANWERSDNWLTDAAVDEWYGVVADSLGRVRWLTLSANGLRGPIVPELGNLSALEFLGLAGNDLIGDVPAEIASATKLTGLWINDNVLTGIIPSTFLALSQLRVIDFSGNSGLCMPSTARFVEWTDSVSQVSGLDCSEADAEVLRVLYRETGGSLDNWTNASGWLSDAALSEWHGVETDSVGRVSGLDLSENGLSGQLPDSLAELSALVKLDVSDNILTGALPVTLTELALEELRYSDTRLCVPQDQDFLDWLADIAQHEGSGRECPPTSQYDILAAIYEATDGPNWNENDNWLTDAPLHDWYGVGTDEDGQVTTLELRWNFLNGRIPPAIGGLSKLSSLRLGGDYTLTGPLPDELFDLPELRSLLLGGFNLAGPIPPEIGKLKQLETLYMWDAGLGGPLPVEIAQLTNLRWLDLSYNDLLGPIPAELGKLERLAELNLGYNEFTGEMPSELGNLTDLHVLSLEHNRLTGHIPEELGNLANLHALRLHKNDLEGVVPPELGALTDLESLWLSWNPRLSGPLPGALTGLRALNSLQAGNTGVCAAGNDEFLTWLDGIKEHRVARCELGATVYLTQQIQSFTFPVPLVAGRPALLRVFFASPHAAGDRMPAVRATFYHGETEVHAADIPGGVAPIPTEVDESSLAASANADIPGEVLKPGLEIVIEVEPEGTLNPALGIASRIPETGRLAVDVRQMPDLQLTLVPFLYEPEPDRSILEITAGMASDPETHPMFKHTRALLPIGDFDVTLHDPVVTSTNDGFQLLFDTEAMRVMEGRPGYWMAMLAPLPKARLLGVAEVGRWTSYSVPHPRTIAHEIGHNMNLWHAPCGGAGGPDPLFPDRNGRIGSWGYDRERGKLISPYATDLMSYCRGGWISDYHVTNSLRHRLDAETSVPAPKTKSVLVWGGRDAAGKLFLEPTFVVDAIPSLPPEGNEYRVRGRTEGGGEVFSLTFDMPYIPDVGDDRSGFVFAIPVTWTEPLASISLAGGDESVVLGHGTNLPMTIVRDAVTGQIRAMLREPETAAMGVFGATEARRLEVSFSRGIPDAAAWRR